MDFLLIGMIIIWIIISRIAEYYSKKEEKAKWVSDLLVIVAYCWLFGLTTYIIKLIFEFLSGLPSILVFIFLLYATVFIISKGKEVVAGLLEILGVLFLISAVVYLPVYLVNVYFDISIKTILFNLLILLSWFFLFIVSTLVRRALYYRKEIESITGFLFLVSIVYGVYILLKYVFRHPESIPIFTLIIIIAIFIMILLTVIYKYIFPTPEIEININKLPIDVGKMIKTRWELLLVPFLIAIFLSLFYFQLEFTIDTDLLYWFYSTNCQVFGTLLGIVVMFAVFILQSKPHEVLTEKFIKSVQGISILYGSTISISFIGLILTSSIEVLNIHEIYTLIDSCTVALFIMAILLIFTSIILTIYILFEIVSVLQPDKKMPKVAFDETRLYRRHNNNDFETRIFTRQWYGCSEFASALTGFRVSRISSMPITYKKLQKYRILIIMRSDKDYYNDEIDAIEKFVKSGGGLFLTCNFWKGNINFSSNSIAKRFGVTFANNGKIYQSTNYYDNVKKTSKISDIETHEITKGISVFCLHNGTYMLDTGLSNILAHTDGDAWFDKFGDDDLGDQKKGDNDITDRFPVLSEMTYGRGRVVFMSSNFNFTNEWWDKEDNKQLGLNIVKWLAGATIDSSQKIEEFIYEPTLHQDG